MRDTATGIMIRTRTKESFGGNEWWVSTSGTRTKQAIQRMPRLQPVTRLVLLALLLALARLSANLLIVLLEGGEVLAGLGELALLHALADVPVDEGALGVHQVELVVDAREELGD